MATTTSQSAVPGTITGSLAANEARAAQLLALDWRLLIGGELVSPEDGRTFPVISPYTEEVIASVPNGSAADAGRAVAAAKRACPGWAALPAAERAAAVRTLADVIEQRGRDLALLDAVGSGAPISLMAADVCAAADALRYFAGLALEVKGDTTPASTNLHYTERQPYGVVVKIIPFNHPLMFAASEIAAPWSRQHRGTQVG